MHQPVSRGLAVFADAWLSGWLAEISADLRENGSALEVVLHAYALYKSTFTLLYFTRMVTTYVGKPSAVGQPTRPTQPSIIGRLSLYIQAYAGQKAPFIEATTRLRTQLTENNTPPLIPTSSHNLTYIGSTRGEDMGVMDATHPEQPWTDRIDAIRYRHGHWTSSTSAVHGYQPTSLAVTAAAADQPATSSLHEPISINTPASKRRSAAVNPLEVKR